MPVEVGTILEYTMASRWATNTTAKYRLEVQFVGALPHAAEVVIPAGQDLGYVAWQSLLADQDVQIAATVQGYAQPVTAPLEMRPDPIRPELGLGKRMFQGVRSWTVEVPEGGCDLVLRMPHSIQTTELREDLMLVVRDAKGKVLHRHIAYEIDTELGHHDAGSYEFELTFPALGAAMVQQAYALAADTLKDKSQYVPPALSAEAPAIDRILRSGLEVNEDDLSPLFSSPQASLRELGATIAAEHFSAEQNLTLARKLLTNMNDDMRLSGAILVGLTGQEPVGIEGDLAAALRYLVDAKYDVYAIQVLSPQEVEPSKGEIAGDLRLEDIEDGDIAEVSISPALVKRYKTNLQAYCQHVRDACMRRGISYMAAETDVPFENVILRYLRERGLLG